jgi:hypothetical protein
VIFIYLTGSLLFWLLCARLDYRLAVRRGWLAAVTYGGGEPTQCQDYRRTSHPIYKCCPKCAGWSRENFGASRRSRALLALLTGPLFLLAALAGALVTGKQPLSASEREHRLKQAEQELEKATDELARLRKTEG